MKQASPMKKIESLRKLLRQESIQNELRIMTNQDNFKNLINPEVTRKDYSIMNRKGSSAKNDFFIGNS